MADFSIVFEDLPFQKVFKATILEAIDIGEYRYVKKEIIAEEILDYIENNLIEIADKTLNLYYSWTKEDIVNAEKIRLSQR
ncbi:MAG: hypothetical protein JST21_05300 [Bacteroidetes bacterium]|nr:hypothetical protein [Bacteroidota bacterium]